MKMIRLEQFWKESDTESWQNFVSLCDEFWIDSVMQTQLLTELSGDIEIAKVINYHLLENALKWISTKVPALDDLTPLECMKTEILKKRLKTALLRFP